MIVRLPHRDLKPDAQAFDEIRIVTVPRWKESELSGDEWRISAKVQFYRNGCVLHEVGYGRNIESAVMGLGGLFQQAQDEGRGFFGGEGNFCDQEGCANTATITYRKLFDFAPGSGTKIGPSDGIRRFCERHRGRGDCGLDDADRNYEVVE